MALKAWDTEGITAKGGPSGRMVALDFTAQAAFESPWLDIKEDSLVLVRIVATTPLTGGTTPLVFTDLSLDASNIIPTQTAGPTSNTGAASFIPTTIPMGTVQRMKLFGTATEDGLIAFVVPAGASTRIRYTRGAVLTSGVADMTLEVYPVNL